MIKKIIKGVLIIVILIALFFFGIDVFTGYQEAKYDDIAVPYLKNAIEQISTWDSEKAKLFLSEEALKEINENDLQKMFKWFSKLGKLISYEEPVFNKIMSGASIKEGSYRMIFYTVKAKYEKGDAILSIQLLDKDNDLKIYNFYINSEAFIE